MHCSPELSWSSVATFVRQHTHDIRNHINGLDLEAALLADVVTDPEAIEGVARVRSQLRNLTAAMRDLSARFAEPQCHAGPLSVGDLFLIFQDEAKRIEKLQKVEWKNETADQNLNVDAAALSKAIRELLLNARDFSKSGEISVTARPEVNGGQVIFEIRESKEEAVSTEGWGCKPFLSTRRGGYGLGLVETHAIVSANGGKIEHRYDAAQKQLVTTLRFSPV